MKTKFLYYALLFVILTLTACKDSNDTPNTPKPEETPDFKIEIKSVTETAVEFCITPADMEMTYIAMMTTKEYFDNFEDDEAYINDDISWFYDIAYNEGLSFEEVVEQRLQKGVVNDTQDTLDPNTEYYVYAYGLTKSGKLLTPLYKELFTTKSPELTELSFDVTVSDIGYNEAIMNVKPNDKSALYFMNVLSKADHEYFGGDDQAYAEHLTQLRNYYLGKGATTEQMVANLGAVGDKQLKVDKLKPGMKYYAYAIGITNDFIANSKATVIEFETIAAEISDLTFEVDITHIYYDRIEGSVTPSNDEETYICSVQLADALYWYDSEADFMDAIISDITYWGDMASALRRGVASLDSIVGLSPNKEYVLVCFGYNGAPTTAPHITHFTTPEATGGPEDLYVTFKIRDITHNTVKITTTPSVGVYYFTFYTDTAGFDAKVSELGSIDAAVAYYADYEIDYGAEWFGCSRAEYLSEVGACIGRYTSMYNQLEPSTDYIAYAIAVDITTGKLASTRGFVSERFRTLDKIVSDARVSFTFGDYYDGTALAELDPARFLNCKGYAVLPYTVTTNDTATTWYTTFSEGDYTSWGCTDDDIYAELITYGIEWGIDTISENRTSGVAILKYDTPYSFLGIAKNTEGHYGLGTLDVVTLTRDGISPADEFIATHPNAKPAMAVKRVER